MGLQMVFANTGTTLIPPLFGQILEQVSFSLMPCILLGCEVGLFVCTERLVAIIKKKPLYLE